MSADFTWLHLSDLHVGMPPQKTLWPNLKHIFFADLQRLRERIDGWDLVIFSGDLVQSGTPGEYALLNEILEELWEKFRSWGTNPNLFCLPGNHDLTRPESERPEVVLLSQWITQPAVRDQFFREDANPYRQVVSDAFENYERWHRGVASTDIPLSEDVYGLLPGDASTIIKLGEKRVGVVGLNSTWLQLVSGDFEGKLHVDQRQLLSVTDGDATAWCAANDLNILVTHHPDNWLSNDSHAEWRTEIDPPGRFGVHLFGHKHRALASSVSIGGSIPRNSFQAPSLFGLEKLADGTTDRLHGYGGGAYHEDQNGRKLRLWPRIAKTSQSGERQLVADMDFTLEEDGSFQVPLVQPTSGALAAGKTAAKFAAVAAGPSHKGALQKAAYHLPRALAHLHVRRVEQEEFLATYKSGRISWLISEWGMGSDEFLWAALKTQSQEKRPVYKIEFGQEADREKLIAGAVQNLGFGFEQFAEHLSAVGPACLLVDSTSVGGPIADGVMPMERQLEEISGILSEYCPALDIIIRSRIPPQRALLPIVILRPLDEPDLKTYVAEHDKGGPELAAADNVSALFRHTDGIPASIDLALKELQVVSLADLVGAEREPGGIARSDQEPPVALLQAVRELGRGQGDRSPTRELLLLRALSMFPYGERLAAIKRFDPTRPFFPKHATELFDRALIEISSFDGIEKASNESSKRLVVPRPIRDFLRDAMSESQVDSLSRRAADLYFGPEWRNGSTNWPSDRDYSHPKCEPWIISNAAAIIVRLFRSPKILRDEREVDALTTLSLGFSSSLISGVHFRSAALFCEDVLPLIPDSDVARKHRIALDYGRSLRMLGRRSEAISVLSSLNEADLDNWDRQTVFINLSLSYENNGQIPESLEAANKVIEINPHSSNALHAEAIITKNSGDETSRMQKLFELEQKSIKRNAEIVSNNLTIYRADNAANYYEKISILEEMLSDKNRVAEDFYNTSRAAVKLADAVFESGRALNTIELSRLMSSYQFLFNERLGVLFDRCHDLLWKTFETNKETENLLSLFRHSSLIWRLRGGGTTELKYIRFLADYLAKEQIDVGHGVAAAYYRTRSAATHSPHLLPVP